MLIKVIDFMQFKKTEIYVRASLKLSLNEYRRGC